MYGANGSITANTIEQVRNVCLGRIDQLSASIAQYSQHQEMIAVSRQQAEFELKQLQNIVRTIDDQPTGAKFAPATEMPMGPWRGGGGDADYLRQQLQQEIAEKATFAPPTPFGIQNMLGSQFRPYEG